jgi:PAS domain S-box-containing protein
MSLADGRILTPPGGTIAEDIAQVQQMIAQHAARAEAAVQAHLADSFPTSFKADVAVSSAEAPSNLLGGTNATAASLPQALAASVAKRPAPAVLTGTTTSTARRRPKSEAQVNRRRERNRVLARRTRLRKKFFFEGLQKEVMDLQREYNTLKNIIRRNIDQNVADEILKDTHVELPSVIMENYDAESGDLDRQDFTLIRSLQSSQQCFVITDPSLLDNPIVYASEGFLTLTKYTKEEILGRNCRFLQGPETSKDKVEKLRCALAAGQDVSVCIANYTADGEAFWNQLFVAALRDVEDNIVNFVGVLVKVPRPGPDDPEHDKILIGSQESTQENIVKG